MRSRCVLVLTWWSARLTTSSYTSIYRVVNNKGQIMPDAFQGSAVGNRLKKHLTTLKISDGETMHSFRAGCSITLSLLGASDDDVAQHVGWKSLATARYYTQTRHVMNTSKTAALLSESAAPASSTLPSQASRVGSLFRSRNYFHWDFRRRKPR